MMVTAQVYSILIIIAFCHAERSRSIPSLYNSAALCQVSSSREEKANRDTIIEIGIPTTHFGQIIFCLIPKSLFLRF